jgi:putative transposase
MYDWRKMSKEERIIALKERRDRGDAWHRPSETVEGKWLHVSAVCYEHRALIGLNPKRMFDFCDALLDTVQGCAIELSAWCLLPNHYHILIRVADEGYVKKKLGQLHGRSSHEWNIEENLAGRKCFHSCLLKPVKSLSHRWATLNYIHHNPVKHGYTQSWQEWPYSSANTYLKSVGINYARGMWTEFPILEMGKGWDE